MQNAPACDTQVRRAGFCLLSYTKIMKLTANDFTTAFPDEWEDRTMITLVAPFSIGKFAANCLITKTPVADSESLEDFVQEQTEEMRQTLLNFQVLDYRTNTLNGLPSCQQLQRFQTENAIVQQVQTYILAKQNIYVITGTADIENFNAHLSAFRQVVENFQITN